MKIVWNEARLQKPYNTGTYPHQRCILGIRDINGLTYKEENRKNIPQEYSNWRKTGEKEMNTKIKELQTLCEIELYFHKKVSDYDGNDEWLKVDHYSVVEIEDDFITKTLFQSVSKNHCISYMAIIYKENGITIQRSCLYKQYKDL